MRLLDLFCGAGGAAVGYHRAGLDEIVGVDNRPQPRYPFTFVEADALEYVAEHGHEFDAVHASPPCQQFSRFRRRGYLSSAPDLVAATRAALDATHSPSVIENVQGAPLLNPATLCGYTLGLRILRHRLFETTFLLLVPSHKEHPEGLYWSRRPRKATMPSREALDLAPYIPYRGREMRQYRAAMECDWMTTQEAGQAIPPAYTELIGRQLLQHIQAAAEDVA